MLNQRDSLVRCHDWLCLISVIALYDAMTGWVDEGIKLNTVYFDVSEAFGTVSHSLVSVR